MANQPLDQKLAFDTELSLALPQSGTTLIGTLTNEPVILMFKNQTTVTVFVSDNPGSTKGTTMLSGEEIIFDCRGNNGTARNMGFQMGTSFYATATAGTGNVKISSLYAY